LGTIHTSLITDNDYVYPPTYPIYIDGPATVDAASRNGTAWFSYEIISFESEN